MTNPKNAPINAASDVPIANADRRTEEIAIVIIKSIKKQMIPTTPNFNIWLINFFIIVPLPHQYFPQPCHLTSCLSFHKPNQFFHELFILYRSAIEYHQQDIIHNCTYNKF